MNKNGFTLVEVLIGLFIAVVASAYVAKTITSTNKVVASGRETFIATNLAHDGIDLTRALRDTTWFTDADRSIWVTKAGICDAAETHKYVIDPELVRRFTETGVPVPIRATYRKLYIQNDNLKLWIHNHKDPNAPYDPTPPPNTTETPYERFLECRKDSAEKDSVNPTYVTIISTVTWKGQNGIDKSVVLKERLYNWLP